jgi:hypothetical protein
LEEGVTHSVSHVPDSFEHIKAVSPDSFDVTITDPPYPKHVQSNLCSGSLVGKKSVPKYTLSFAPLSSYAFLGDLLRVTRRWVVSFCSIESLGLIQAAHPDEYVRGGVWYKPNSMGQLTADRPATAYECIALLHKRTTKKRWNGKGSYAIWRCNGTRGEKVRHPNQKPLEFCQKLVALFSGRGETIYDPFCGSGRIGEAAVSLGRNYVGLDNELDWVLKARQRIGAVDREISDDEALSRCIMERRIAS